MPDSTPDFSRAVFVKTALGQQEIQTRALKLGPIPRRLLILIDGKRSAAELSGFVAGSNITDLLTELLNKACIAATEVPAEAPVPPAQPAAGTPKSGLKSALVDRFLEQLPEASSRTDKEVEMAKNFMMNTVKTVFPLYSHLSLQEAIFLCNTVQDVRSVYPRWAETMNSSFIGAKRMPEFLEKLLKVL